jgi:hypothetical protein
MKYSYNKGGKSYGLVPGKGHPKSDDLDMRVKPGHVVPAEHAKEAMNLVAMMGYDPNVHVQMNQGGGLPIKISSGEYFLNEEQVSKMKKIGLNPELLSPNSPYNTTVNNTSMQKMNLGGRVKLTMPSQEDENNNQDGFQYYNGGDTNKEKEKGTYEAPGVNTPMQNKNQLNAKGWRGNEGYAANNATEQDVYNLGFRNLDEFRNFYTTNIDKNYDFRNNQFGPQHKNAYIQTQAWLAQNPDFYPGQITEKVPTIGLAAIPEKNKEFLVNKQINQLII